MTQHDKQIYRVLVSIQIISVLIITGCAAYLAGYFG